MYRVNYQANGKHITQVVYGTEKELDQGVARVKALYRYLGEVYASITVF